MRKKTALMLGELQTKLNGCILQLNYEYMNLCIKAEPVSLLPVGINLMGNEYKIEDLAFVSQLNEKQMLVIPKIPKILIAIEKGIAKIHPEFKQEPVDAEYGLDDNSKGKKENAEKNLLLTMPTVDEDRKDLLLDTVKLLYDKTKVRIDGYNAQYGQRIAVQLSNASPEEIDEAKKGLKGCIDTFSQYADKYRENKVEEIEDAYKLYLEEQAAKEQKEREAKAETNEEAKTGFNLSEYAKES